MSTVELYRDKYLHNPVKFAQDVLGVKDVLWYNADLLECNFNRVVQYATRQTGKSLTLAIAVLYEGFVNSKEKNFQAMVVCPTRSQAIDFLSKLGDLGAGDLSKYEIGHSVSTLCVRYEIGDRSIDIYIFGGKNVNLNVRGYGFVDMCVIDDANSVTDENIHGLMVCVREHGKKIMSSTKYVESGFWWKCVNSAIVGSRELIGTKWENKINSKLRQWTLFVASSLYNRKVMKDVQMHKRIMHITEAQYKRDFVGEFMYDPKA